MAFDDKLRNAYSSLNTSELDDPEEALRNAQDGLLTPEAEDASRTPGRYSTKFKVVMLAAAMLGCLGAAYAKWPQSMERSTVNQQPSVDKLPVISLASGTGTGPKPVIKKPTKKPEKDSPADLAKHNGVIYGIFKIVHHNADASIKDKRNCVYIGKTNRVNEGDRFIEHVDLDKTCPWYRGKPGNAVFHTNDWPENTNDWPYIHANILRYNGWTNYDIAVAEQYYIQQYALQYGAPLTNQRNEVQPSRWTANLGAKRFTKKILWPSSKWPGGLGLPGGVGPVRVPLPGVNGATGCSPVKKS